jgi:predicted HTH transcriptional regulator
MLEIMPTTNNNKQTRGLKELFASFLENPTRSGLREILQNHLGETRFLDFKLAWETPSKTAKHVLGLANSQGGGLIIGVSQKADNSFDIIGLPKFEDKADITKSIQKYLPPKVAFEVLDFSYEDSDYAKLRGKRFQILLVEDTPTYVPFISNAEGEGIRKNTIYIRRQGETAEANSDELQEVINRRIETQYSTRNEQALEKTLKELKTLYDFIPKYVERGDWESLQYVDYVRNPDYPQEGFENFIRKLIGNKKKEVCDLLKK